MHRRRRDSKIVLQLGLRRRACLANLRCGERCSNISLPRGAQPSGQRQSDLVSFAAGGNREHGSSAASRTTGRGAEVLREGSGIKIDATAGHGLSISTYIKDAGDPHWQKRCRARFIINVRRAMSSGSRQRPGRVFSPYGISPQVVTFGHSRQRVCNRSARCNVTGIRADLQQLWWK
jgi:hypothetical protein